MSKDLSRYLGWNGKLFGGISAVTEEFLDVYQPGRKVFGGISGGREEFFRYLGRDGTVQKRTFLTYLNYYLNYFNNVL